MKRLKLGVTLTAERQIEEQVLYIARASVDNAIAWEQRLRTTLLGLRDFHGHAIDESASERIGMIVRKVVFERTFLIHYRVDEPNAVVQVINFRHGARHPRADEP